MEKYNIKYPLRLFPDWEIKTGIALVWPEGIKKYRQGIDVISVYKDLISKIPATAKLLILSRDLMLRKNMCNPELDVRFIHNPEIDDIWIRDFAPMTAEDHYGKDVLVKFKYSPSYLYKKESSGSDKVGRSISGILGKPMYKIPLVLDGGNLTHNGNGCAIVTRRIISDNTGFSRKNIESIFMEELGITSLVIIEEEPGDPTGHVDGNIRFISPGAIAVNVYPAKMKKENQYLNRIVRAIRKQTNDAFEMHEIPSGMLFDTIIDYVPGIFGNHINFLRIGKYLFIPIYGIPSDIKAIELFQKHLPDVKIITVEAGPLSHYGGALNCFSWTF